MRSVRMFTIGALVITASCETRDATPTKGSRPKHYDLGRTPTEQEIAALNVDVNPTGAGLPPGQGTATTGAAVYLGKCAACHGMKGEGIDKNPKLIGTTPPAGFTFANDVKAPKTIGNYWPYATTLYDYIHRVMPHTAPGSLTPDEIYGVVAYLLSENGVIAKDQVIDATSLPKVKMPAQSRFVKDNRKGGQDFR